MFTHFQKALRTWSSDPLSWTTSVSITNQISCFENVTWDSLRWHTRDRIPMSQSIPAAALQTSCGPWSAILVQLFTTKSGWMNTWQAQCDHYRNISIFTAHCNFVILETNYLDTTMWNVFAFRPLRQRTKCVRLLPIIVVTTWSMYSHFPNRNCTSICLWSMFRVSCTRALPFVMCSCAGSCCKMFANCLVQASQNPTKR